jgi:predicted transglutaminase-like cysteine proteinase
MALRDRQAGWQGSLRGISLPTGSPNQRTMDRSPAFWRIFAWAGFLLAGVLCMVDPLEPFSYSSAHFCLPTAYSIEPGSFAEIEVKGSNALHEASATIEEPARLFGLDTEPVTDGALLDKWRRVEALIANDFDVMAQCQAGKTCAAPAQKLVNLSLEGAGRNERARVGVINRAVDLAIRPVSDEALWGVPDHWSDPLETLQSSSGDCEDYAIVKYTALLAAGLSKDAVKVVVWRNRMPNEYHAVVAVRVDHQWLILDNRTLTLVHDTDVTRAIPEFVLDDQGVRRFVRRDPIRKAAT